MVYITDCLGFVSEMILKAAACSFIKYTFSLGGNYCFTLVSVSNAYNHKI